MKSIWRPLSSLFVIAAIGLLCGACKDCKKYAHAKDEQPAPIDLEGNLLRKLEVVKVESDIWLLDFSGVIGNSFQLKLKHKPFGGRVEENRISAAKTLEIGDIFFTNEPGKARFKLKAVETQEADGQFGRVQRKRAIVEDLSDQKKGKTYKISYRLKKDEQISATQFDHTVVFRLDSNENAGSEFSVEENGIFSLPPGEKEKPFKLIEVKMEEPITSKLKVMSVVVQYEVDGKTKTREIPASQ